MIVGAVPFDYADQTIVYGVNHEALKPDSRVLSAASCTTHCIAPVLAALDREFGVRQALMKEIAYTSTRPCSTTALTRRAAPAPRTSFPPPAAPSRR